MASVFVSTALQGGLDGPFTRDLPVSSRSRPAPVWAQCSKLLLSDSRSLWHAMRRHRDTNLACASFGNANTSHMQGYHMQKNRHCCRCFSCGCCLQRDALVYNAAAEVGTGLLLIIMLATPRRAILLTFLYWNWLRMRYFSPDAATYHNMVRQS